MKLSGQLQARVAEIAASQKLKQDEAFALWFLTAWTAATEDEARPWLCGGTGDKGADALMVDDKTNSVILVQAKWRTASAGSPEHKEHVHHPVFLAETLLTGGEPLERLVAKRPTHIKDVFRKAHKRLAKDARLDVVFLTTGTISDSIRSAAADSLSNLSSVASFVAHTWRDLDLLWADYQAGAAPPIPPFTLETEPSTAPLQRIDKKQGLETWILATRGDQIGEKYQRFGDRLFARNIRGDMGDSTEVNSAIQETIKKNPQDFFYLNNGLTILCDRVLAGREADQHTITLHNAQIVNGQQTTRALAQDRVASQRATVLVKVIRFDRGDAAARDYDDELSLIVQGTNRQNKIVASDLWSNESRQVLLEREFRRRGYHYLRKRQTKSAAGRAWLGFERPKLVVKKEEIAQVLAATNLKLESDLVAKVGKEGLFDQEFYNDVFRSKTDVDFYLAVAWLGRLVSIVAKRMKPRRHGWKDLRWAVLRWFAKRGPKLLAKTELRKAFLLSAENDVAWTEFKALSSALFSIGLNCFDAHVKKNADTVYDMHDYFRTPAAYREFERTARARSGALNLLLKKWLIALQQS